MQIAKNYSEESSFGFGKSIRQETGDRLVVV